MVLKCASWVLLIVMFLLWSSYKRLAVYDLKIKITGIRNEKGSIQLHVYSNSNQFETKTPTISYRITKYGNVNNGILEFNDAKLEEGVYGIALLDDENNNTKMDYGWLLPLEGYAFSDYYHTGFTHPGFEQFKFNLNADQQITMKIRHM